MRQAERSTSKSGVSVAQRKLYSFSIGDGQAPQLGGWQRSVAKAEEEEEEEKVRLMVQLS
jgi:hypothetical protein